MLKVILFGQKNQFTLRLKEAVINGDKNQEIEAIVNSNRDPFISTGDNSVVSNNSNIAKAVKEDNNPSFWKPVWDFEDGVNNFLAQHFNNPVGRFMSRISITGGNIATFGNGSKEIADTGSPTANKIADIMGTCAGVVFNPEAGLESAVGMVKGIKGVQGFLARKIENVGNKAA